MLRAMEMQSRYFKSIINKKSLKYKNEKDFLKQPDDYVLMYYTACMNSGI